MFVKWFFRLILNSVLGFLLLIILNAFGDAFNIGLGINPVNSIVIGFLGLPGLALLLIIRYLLVI